MCRAMPGPTWLSSTRRPCSFQRGGTSRSSSVPPGSAPPSEPSAYNRVRHGLQPHELWAATACAMGCNCMSYGLQPLSLPAATLRRRGHRGQAPATCRVARAPLCQPCPPVRPTVSGHACSSVRSGCSPGCRGRQPRCRGRQPGCRGPQPRCRGLQPGCRGPQPGCRERQPVCT